MAFGIKYYPSSKFWFGALKTNKILRTNISCSFFYFAFNLHNIHSLGIESEVSEKEKEKHILTFFVQDLTSFTSTFETSYQRKNLESSEQQ